MLIYTATKKEFNDDVISNCISDKILSSYKHKMGKNTNKSEIRSWQNSMQYMNNVLFSSGIPDNTGISIEYKIPLSSKRIDFIITGKDKNKNDTAIIVELKQWDGAEKTQKDGIVSTYLSGRQREVEHPSYQAWTYAELLKDFNETIREDNIKLFPCAYLHNCSSNDVINHSFYNEYTSKAPAFLKSDAQRLSSFIKRFVKYGDADKIMYRIEHGKIRPSKNLADMLVSLLKGNQEFLMIDDQKIVYETVLELAHRSTEKEKHVLIVEGGPGTGKTVIAINLLVELINREFLVQYVTKNAAPRDVYESKLTGTYKKSHISNLFKSSGVYTDCEENTFQVLIVDEAHRLNGKSGMFQNKGENQIKEIIQAAKHSVFFIDEDQRVTFKDIGEKKEIIRWAEQLGVKIHEMKLSSQFRCNGSDGYLAWVNNVLQIKETANQDFGDIDYEFQVLDSPNDLKDIILRKNEQNNKARLVAGYCWDWITKDEAAPNLFDITIDEHNFSTKWNLKNDGNLWLVKPESVNEIGCIHTCQGLELDYVGVIIGPDLQYRNGEIITKPENRAKTDASIRGYKKLLKENPTLAKKRAEAIIKNTYRTLMTRGQKGCYVYSTDPETNAYFKSLLQNKPLHSKTDSQIIKYSKENNPYPGLTLPLLNHDDVEPFVNAVPIYDLQIAAGFFSETQNIMDHQWVSLPDFIKPSPDLFVAQVIGESMNKRIPNGSWCLFRKNPVGSRQGKIVLVQHQDIYDEDSGGQFTIKRYYSEKSFGDDGSWEHSKIILKPETTSPGYDKIIINENNTNELKVIGEFIAVF